MGFRVLVPRSRLVSLPFLEVLRALKATQDTQGRQGLSLRRLRNQSKDFSCLADRTQASGQPA